MFFAGLLVCWSLDGVDHWIWSFETTSIIPFHTWDERMFHLPFGWSARLPAPKPGQNPTLTSGLLSRPLQVHRCHTRLPSEALSARDILLPIKQRFYQYWRVTFNYWITIELCCTKLYNFVKQSGFLKSTSWHKFNKILNVGLYLLYVPSIQDSTVKIKHSSATLCQHFGQWIVNWNKSMLYRALNKSILMYAMWTRLKWSQSTDF